jgi:ABC-type multidrug transport system ATPase subunit
MRIVAQNLGKRFNRDWVFRNFRFTSEEGRQYVILGPNGSGKSTLLQILTGIIPSSEGTLTYQNSESEIPAAEIYKSIATCAPYQDLIDEFTLDEMIRFHFKFKKCIVPISEFTTRLELGNALNKFVGSFSSGMKQRLKVGLALYSNCDLLFLDEPCTNMDNKSIGWYQENLKSVPSTTTTFIASNQSHEYPNSAYPIEILRYK